jgi:two-component system, OmpR family, KDP operon response regulator KdpE
MNARALVVSGNPQAVKALANPLVSRGYEVRTANDADSAVLSLLGWHPTFIIADLERPQLDGADLCRRVRRTSNVPIILISSDDDGLSEVEALDSGADDYLVKPFTMDLLMAHVRVAIRRGGPLPEASALGVGEFEIDFHDRRVRVHGQPVRLTPKEFDLFVFMARHPNRVLPHRTLLGAVWGEASEGQSEYLRVFMGQLRKKLESDPSKPRYLVTEPWVGYRFNPTGLMQ